MSLGEEVRECGERDGHGHQDGDHDDDRAEREERCLLAPSRGELLLDVSRSVFSAHAERDTRHCPVPNRFGCFAPGYEVRGRLNLEKEATCLSLIHI